MLMELKTILQGVQQQLKLHFMCKTNAPFLYGLQQPQMLAIL